MRILVVDDDASTRKALTFLLRSEGHEVETCDGPEPALAQLASTPIDALLTDQVMDGIPGLELARRAQALRSGLRCLVMSGHPSPPPEECAHVTWVSKPIDLDRLLAALEAPAR